MKSFWRLFRYIWPQWHRVMIVFTSAILMGILFSFSLAAFIPVLKVMINEEDIQGWADRNICKWRYGLDFYVPEASDFLKNDSTKIANCLKVVKVKDKGPAYNAHLKQEDRIIGVGSSLTSKEIAEIPRSKLLTELAAADGNSITLQVEHNSEISQVKMAVPGGRFYEKWARGLAGFFEPGQTKSGKFKVIVYIIIAVLLGTVIRCIATFTQKYYGEKIVNIAAVHIREDVFSHVTKMPIGFFAKQGTSDTISRILRDIAQSSDGINNLLGKALREPGKAVGALCVALILSWQLTLIFMIAAPAAILLGISMGRQIKKATKKSLIAWSEMLGRVSDMVSALRVVKVYNRQSYELEVYKQLNRKLLKRILRISKVDSASSPVLEVLGMIGGSAALILGFNWVLNYNMKPTVFFTLIAALVISAESVRKTVDVWNKIQMSNAAAERVFSLLDSPVEYENENAPDLPPIKRQIEFKNISFTYPGSQIPALDGVNLVIKAGTIVAIVGPNGSGKTTLANLVPRFYDPDSGQVLIDDADIRQVTLYSLRNQIGMVTQNVVTFNNTVAANIAYGKENATEDDIIKAAKRAYAHEFIAPLPDGYKTIIGEQGSGLSGGQLQRIVIARAILKNPPILIFDEATSQIDADSEAKIHQALEEIMHDRTTIIIAHRFSTIIKADLIVVMDKGRIVAAGRHSNLTRDCLLYQSLYETQLIKPD